MPRAADAGPGAALPVDAADLRVTALLPAADEAVRCAMHARAHGFEAAGTAITADLLVLVDLPRPWPKPVFEHDLLNGITAGFDTTMGPARILAARPEASDRLEVHVFVRAGGETLTTSMPWADRHDLDVILDGLRIGRMPPLVPVRPTVLVCTQGTHDVCCGSEGSRLVHDLRSLSGVRIREVSHLGGHRFAPTVLTLPGGRMWANVDAALVGGILDRSGDASDAASQCRGWWGAAKGPEQAAENAVFARVGWTWEDLDRSVLARTAEQDAGIYTVRGGPHTFDVSVRVSRVVPTIACRAIGGLPVKLANEYEAAILDGG